MDPSRRRLRWDLGLGREIGLTFWGMVLLEAAFGSYMGVWPLWIERLGAPITVVGFVLGSSGVIRLLFLVPSAALADRFNIRNLIVVARCGAFIGLLGASVAQHWTQLALMVVGSAVGELAFPLIQTHVAANAAGNRIRAFSLVFTVGPSVALALSPLVAGALIALWGLRAAFLLAAVFTACSILCFARLNPGVRETSVDSPKPASTYSGAIADPAVRRILILQGSTVFILALGTSLIPTFLEDVRGMSASRIATLGALAAVGSTAFGIIVARATRLQAAPFYGIAIAVTATCIGFAIFLSTSLLPLIGLAFILRGGLFSAWAMCSAAIGVAASVRHRARSFALGEMVAGTSFSIAPMMAGWLFSIENYLPLMFATIGGLALVPVLILAQRAAFSRPQGDVDSRSPASDHSVEAPLPL
jgi:predicted MFS family arabinose efflux permease